MKSQSLPVATNFIEASAKRAYLRGRQLSNVIGLFDPLLGDVEYMVAGRPPNGVPMHYECRRNAESIDEFASLINKQSVSLRVVLVTKPINT